MTAKNEGANNRNIYIIGVIATAIIAALLQYLAFNQSKVHHAEDIKAAARASLIDKDNVQTLPKWQITGLTGISTDGKKFLFDSGTANLQTADAGMQSVVKNIVSTLVKESFKTLEITGQYRDGQNHELGVNRANAILKVFTDAGLSNEQIVTKAAKTQQIPTFGSKSVASSIAIITDADKLKAFEANALAETEKAARTAAEEKLKQFEGDNASFSGQLQQITSEKNGLTETLAQVTADLGSAEEKLKQFEGDNASFSGQLQQITSEKDGLTEKLAKVTDDLDSAEEKISQLTGDKASALDKLVLLNLRKGKVDEKLVSLESKLADSLKANVQDDSAKKIISGLEDKLSGFEIMVKSLNTELEVKSSELTKAISSPNQLEPLKSQLTEVENAKVEVETELSALKQQLEESETEKTNVVEELEQEKLKTADVLNISNHTAKGNLAKIANLSKQLSTEETAHSETKDKLAAALSAKGKAESQLTKVIETQVLVENSKVEAFNSAEKSANDQIADTIRKVPLYLYFRTNQTVITLDAQQKQKVDLIKNYMAKVSNAEVLVIGHTDNVGQHNTNIRLGLKRANFAADWLTQSGIVRDKMIVESKGPDAPIVNNNTRVNRAKNRRVEVTIK